MPKPREPIELIQAKGRKHLTRAEIKKRMETEPKPCNDDLTPPPELTKKQAEKFNKIAAQLDKIGIIGETDVDALARYIRAEEMYESATKDVLRAEKSRPKGDDFQQLVAWSALIGELDKRQERYFKQAQKCASDLGLTISSRCKLVVPKAEEKEHKNKFENLDGGMIQ